MIRQSKGIVKPETMTDVARLRVASNAAIISRAALPAVAQVYT